MHIENVKQLTVGFTGPDWKPTSKTRFFAQVDDGGDFAFGSTMNEAVNNLRKRLLDKEAERIAKLFTVPSNNQ